MLWTNFLRNMNISDALKIKSLRMSSMNISFFVNISRWISRMNTVLWRDSIALCRIHVVRLNIVKINSALISNIEYCYEPIESIPFKELVPFECQSTIVLWRRRVNRSCQCHYDAITKSRNILFAITHTPTSFAHRTLTSKFMMTNQSIV